MATARSGGPALATSAARRAISARTCLRNFRTCSGSGGLPESQSLVSRAAPSGSEIATSGSSSRPAAISSDPPPMSSMSTRPEDQPNQRRQARKVSRASSSPVSTLIATPVPSWTEASTSSPLAASRTAEVAKASSSSTPLSSAICSASSTNSPKLPGDAGRQPVPVVQVIAEMQLGLVGEHRQRPPALMGVDHQEVHRIGADVQHT